MDNDGELAIYIINYVVSVRRLYFRPRHHTFTNTDFRNKQPLIKLQTLLHGHNLNNTERHHIAKHFQTFISKAIHTRQVTVAVAAAVGTGAAHG